MGYRREGEKERGIGGRGESMKDEREERMKQYEE